MLICAVVAIIVMIIKSKSSDDAPDFLENPMLALYQTQPNFDDFIKDSSNTKFRDNFWRNPIYGGPITQSIMRPNPQMNDATEIPNALNNNLVEIWNSKRDIHGFYVLNKVHKKGDIYQDYHIFINDMSLDQQKEMNKTNNTDSVIEFEDIKQYLTGNVRLLEYQSF